MLISHLQFNHFFPSIESEDKDAQTRLQRLLNKVEEMKKQRQTLEGQLRDSLQSDDITSLIVTKEGGNMKVSEEGKADMLKSYSKIGYSQMI